MCGYQMTVVASYVARLYMYVYYRTVVVGPSIARVEFPIAEVIELEQYSCEDYYYFS